MKERKLRIEDALNATRAAVEEGSVIVERLKREEVGVGYNAATGEWVNMIDAGIVDPAKVTRSALQKQLP